MGSLKEAGESPSFEFEGPFDAKRDFDQEPLESLRRALAATGLGVCKIPTA